MNETLRTIAQRWSCRAYDGRPVEKDTLRAIGLAAVQSPSGMNKQPWRIIVITDKALIDEMDLAAMRHIAEAEDRSLYERIMGRGGKMFYNAPCMFVIVKQPSTDLDCGIVSENIALAAASCGLGNVICGMAAIPFNLPNGDYFKSKVGLPDGWEFGVAVLVGFALDEGSPHEPDISKISFIE